VTITFPRAPSDSACPLLPEQSAGRLMAVDFISVTLRALGFTALFQAVGLAFFLALFGRELTQPWPGLHRIGRIAAIAGLLLVLLHPALEAPRMAGGFSAIAGWLVPLILVVGLGMAWILAGSLAVLRQPYGQLLIAKIVGFALLMLLAAANRWRLVPALAAGSPVSALRRSILMEIALLVAVLSTTAVLTTYYSPH